MGFSVLDSCDKLAGYRCLWNLGSRVVRALQEVVKNAAPGLSIRLISVRR